MIIYLVFYCFSAMLGCSYSDVKKAVISTVFAIFKEEVDFSNLPRRILQLLETYKPEQGSLGDGTNHLEHFAQFVTLQRVCTSQFVSLSL
jgi:hypothetical protein